MIPGVKAVGQVTLAAAIPTVTVTASDCFDVEKTVISQYANSPVILALVNYFAQELCAARMYDDLFNDIWNIDTATGFGLDVLARIVGASRIVNVPSSGTYIGFLGQPTAENWDNGIWYNGASSTNNIRLGDDVFRRVIKAKALANVWDGTIPSANSILMTLFPLHGNCYMSDDGNMTISYHFGSALSPVEFAIASQEGILPRLCGVATNIVMDPGFGALSIGSDPITVVGQELFP